jgi:hypothetical protein
LAWFLSPLRGVDFVVLAGIDPPLEVDEPQLALGVEALVGEPGEDLLDEPGDPARMIRLDGVQLCDSLRVVPAFPGLVGIPGSRTWRGDRPILFAQIASCISSHRDAKIAFRRIDSSTLRSSIVDIRPGRIPSFPSIFDITILAEKVHPGIRAGLRS